MSEENMGANEGRNCEVKEGVISFRLNPQEYAMVQVIAGLDGEAPNAWARKIALDEARGEEGLSWKQRVLLEEIARLGYLIEHRFGIQLSADRATDAEWRRREQGKPSADWFDILFVASSLLHRRFTVNAVAMAGINSEGFDMLANNQKLRMDFDAPISTVEAARAILVKLARR